MKIKTLKIRNYLGIEELDLSISEQEKIIIEGGNGKGKTSILEAIEKTINSTGDRRPKQVRDGAEQALLLVELDDGTQIKRVIEADGNNKVEVKKDGMKLTKPETFLKSLFSGFSFNPVDFIGKKEKEQAEILLNLIPFKITPAMSNEWFGEIAGIDYTQHGLKALTELSEKYFYNKRAFANSEVKDLKDRIEAINSQLPDNFKKEEWEKQSLSEVYSEIEKIKTVNEKLERAKQIQNEHQEKIESIEAKFKYAEREIEDFKQFKLSKVESLIKEKKQVFQNKIKLLEDEIKELEEKIKQKKSELEDTKKKVEIVENQTRESEVAKIEIEYSEKMKALSKDKDGAIKTQNELLEKATLYISHNTERDISDLKENAEIIEKMKGFIPLAENKERYLQELRAKLEKAEKYDSYVTFCRNKPQEILNNMTLPVKNLGIDKEGNITISDRPIKNLSTAEQLDVAIDIAKATSGELKLICIDKFEAMDKETQEAFFKKTENDGFTYFITQVTEGDLKIK